MAIADLVIAFAALISVLVGFLRGFVKEAISIAALLIAIWAALNFGDDFGELTGSWLSSAELQVWFGRILVFIVVVVVGGLTSWAISKLVRLSVLSGTDRVLGMLFGFGRAALLAGVFALGAELAGFDDARWWQESQLMPYAEIVADWLEVMAPRGFELMQPDENAELPFGLGSPQGFRGS